jgi:hypothetical protein
MSEQSDTPDAPPEVLARQAKSRALTRETADLIKSPDFVDDGGRTIKLGIDPVTMADIAARKARTRAEAYVGGTPVMGLTPAEVATIKGRDYPEAPAMDVELGDRTVAFVNWLYAHHPADAKVRYAYRDIWPTVLPLDWPKVSVTTKTGLHQPSTSVAAPEDPQAELERLRAELAALKKKKPAAPPAKKKTSEMRKVPSRAKAEAPASSPSTSASSS